MHWLARLGVLLSTLTISAARLEAIPPEGLDGLSFAEDPHMLFVPIEEIAFALRCSDSSSLLLAHCSQPRRPALRDLPFLTPIHELTFDSTL